MGGSSTEKDSRTQKAEERIKGYQYIIDSAYTLFDGKYSMKEIETMPYKMLLQKIEKEQELNRQVEEVRKKREEEERHEAERIARLNQGHKIF